jgi:DNA polymerase-3 subunit gamma/tau
MSKIGGKDMHKALYRKWRPQIFEDVIGQDYIITVLKNQIANSKIGHAYLFTGSRGTGKTGTAKSSGRSSCPWGATEAGLPC